MPTVTLQLCPRTAHVRTARLVASAMARRSGVADELLDDVRLAVGEACARAVRLHERHAVLDPVTIELSDGIEFSVVVTDHLPVDPQASGGPGLAATPDRSASGGVSAGSPARDALPVTSSHQWDDPEILGLAVLEGIVDDLRVESDSKGTQVIMVWPADPRRGAVRTATALA